MTGRLQSGAYPLGIALSVALLGMAASCAPTPKPLPPMASAPTIKAVCTDFNFPIYFEQGSDQLTQTARLVVLNAAQRTKGCALGTPDVFGLADADGPKLRNIALARRRALAVAAALKGAGLPAPRFDIDVAETAGAGKEPVHRRTEVVIHVGGANVAATQ